MAKKTSINKLQEELFKKMEERKAAIQERIEEIKVQNEIKKLDSPLYEKRKLEEQDMLQLVTYMEQLEEIYSIDNRKLSRVFGYGVMVDKILTVVRSIQYLKLDEKAEMLMSTGLTESLVEEVLDALGNTAYFSVRQMRIIEEQPADVATLRELLKVVALDMGLVAPLNLNKVNEDNFKYQSTRAQVKAEELMDNTLKYTADSNVSYED